MLGGGRLTNEGIGSTAEEHSACLCIPGTRLAIKDDISHRHKAKLFLSACYLRQRICFLTLAAIVAAPVAVQALNLCCSEWAVNSVLLEPSYHDLTRPHPKWQFIWKILAI